MPPDEHAAASSVATPYPSTDVLIIGGGYSGLATLAHLAKLLPGRSLLLLERQPRNYPGVAYGACDREHLLNVPAGRMGAMPEDAGAFHRWLEAKSAGTYGAADFVPRAMYGEYLNEWLEEALNTGTATITRDRANVTALRRSGAALIAELADGSTVSARAVILASGAPAGTPSWLRSAPAGARARCVADPWAPGALRSVDADANVLIVGSGLTAIDVVQSLQRNGHRGRITMVSRHGRLPLPHTPPDSMPATQPSARFEGSPVAVLAKLRATATEHVAQGLPWQTALDTIRPQVTPIWRSWSANQRSSFLRHARAAWEIHRHRAPRRMLDELQALMDAGRLTLERATVTSLEPQATEQVRVLLRVPGGGLEHRDVGMVINCGGPTLSVRESDDSLLRSLLQSEIGSSDELGIGLRTSQEGRLLDSEGFASAPVFVVGALRRGDLWESTAVPELRLQAAAAALAVSELVLATVSPRTPASPA